ncbi:hypothetical protein [Mesorhizobium denitrificans]|uniref:hypothetical protein n=1 Tax=Mesorhizobium denitrificans TaxID=2294114 RepID=UPI0011C02B7C|nr:hypothetical protein [Mesorhizobium denitrificans]
MSISAAAIIIDFWEAFEVAGSPRTRLEWGGKPIGGFRLAAQGKEDAPIKGQTTVSRRMSEVEISFPAPKSRNPKRPRGRWL